mmetsp:Transcript_24726/g.62159  ORF Transcript_24726/g.62159 Transcript_24726/m.62159 type:complete len:205 (-) Transcript_24726:4413-5027(-)
MIIPVVAEQRPRHRIGHDVRKRCVGERNSRRVAGELVRGRDGCGRSCSGGDKSWGERLRSCRHRDEGRWPFPVRIHLGVLLEHDVKLHFPHNPVQVRRVVRQLARLLTGFAVPVSVHLVGIQMILVPLQFTASAVPIGQGTVQLEFSQAIQRRRSGCRWFRFWRRREGYSIRHRVGPRNAQRLERIRGRAAKNRKRLPVVLEQQ